MPFESTPEYPNLGKPVASKDITGGPGFAGLAELQKFVEQGGVLLTLGGGSTLALEGGLVRSVRRATGTAVFTPGAEIRARFDRPEHPIAYGYGSETAVFRTNLPVYDTPRHWVTMAYCTSCLTGPKDPGRVVMSWGGGGDMVISGGMRGVDELAGKPAVIDTPVGKGHVISYNFNGIHRDMNRGDYRLVWNAIINWNNLGPENDLGSE